MRGVTTRRVKKFGRTIWFGIPVTSPAQTIVDLAAYLPTDDLARICHEADVRHHTRPEQIEAIVDRRPNTPGAPKLRLVLAGDVPLTLSRLESGFLDLLRVDGLELPPETNRRTAAHYVDCRWPHRRLTIELDSYKNHRSRHAWEQDRRREREARARGDDFRRFTWGDVFERRDATLGELRPLLRPAKVGLSDTGR